MEGLPGVEDFLRDLPSIERTVFERDDFEVSDEIVPDDVPLEEDLEVKLTDYIMEDELEKEEPGD